MIDQLAFTRKSPKIKPPLIRRSATFSPRRMGRRANLEPSLCKFSNLLDLVSLVITRVNQRSLPVADIHSDRLQQIGRDDLDLVVIGLGVVDLRLAARNHRIDHASGHLGEFAGVLENG